MAKSDNTRPQDVAEEEARRQAFVDLLSRWEPALATIFDLGVEVPQWLALASIAISLHRTADPTRADTIPMASFIQRFTAAEYLSLLQKRAAAITAGNVTLARMWDIAVARGWVDLNDAATQTFKDGLVSAAILTQARADEIFVV